MSSTVFCLQKFPVGYAIDGIQSVKPRNFAKFAMAVDFAKTGHDSDCVEEIRILF